MKNISELLVLFILSFNVDVIDWITGILYFISDFFNFISNGA